MFLFGIEVTSPRGGAAAAACARDRTTQEMVRRLEDVSYVMDQD